MHPPMKFTMTVFIAGLIILSFLMLPAAPLSAKEPLLRSVSGGRVSLHFAHEIPASEMRLFLDEYTRALTFLDREYPLPYPYHGRIEQYLVTNWRDYTITTFRHKGLLHMYVGPSTLYLADFFGAILLPVAPRYLGPGVAQFLYARYRGEDPYLAAAVYCPTVPQLRLKTVLDPMGTYGPERTAFFGASFVAYLVDNYGWDRSIRFIGDALNFSDFDRNVRLEFGIDAAELEAGWLSSIQRADQRADLAKAGVEPERVRAAFNRFNRLVERWQGIRFPYNQAELVTEYTRCRLLLPSMAELRPMENALGRFEKAIGRAQWVPLVPVLGVIMVLAVHLFAWYCRTRRAVMRIRARRFSAAQG